MGGKIEKSGLKISDGSAGDPLSLHPTVLVKV